MGSMAVHPKKTEVKSGRIGGLLYEMEGADGPMLVLFNQWRSGAFSILSKYLAQLALEKGVYGSVLFIDRIASGGASDNELSKSERENMRIDGEFQFGHLYAEAIENIRQKHDLPKRYVLGGSSAGAPAVLATLLGMSPANRQRTISSVLVEPVGMRRHGFGKKRVAAVSQAFLKHLVAYRHRIRRGWWTPMDKEQYFAKGTMFEYRANWFAGDSVYQSLCKVLSDSSYPPIHLVLSKTSHVHSPLIRQTLKKRIVRPHHITEVTGNHDVVCQPPSLSEIYTEIAQEAYTAKR